MSTKKGVSKDDLKRMMKKMKTDGTIKHPMAKYNSLGHLICTVCNSQVKSDRLWNPHLLSRSHKENVAAPQPEPSLKRLHADAEAMSAKRCKPSPQDNESRSTTIKDKPKSILKNSTAYPISGYSSSDNESASETDDLTQTDKMGHEPSVGQALPSDFFDTNPQKMEEEEEVPMDIKPAESLPEGFFDDPKADAKARNIEYVDKDEEEWEKFQSELKNQVQISEQLQAEEEEVTTEDRHIQEIDQQLAQWAKVNDIVKQKTALMESKMVSVEESRGNDSDSDEDSTDISSILDWRTKALK